MVGVYEATTSSSTGHEKIELLIGFLNKPATGKPAWRHDGYSSVELPTAISSHAFKSPVMRMSGSAETFISEPESHASSVLIAAVRVWLQFPCQYQLAENNTKGTVSAFVTHCIRRIGGGVFPLARDFFDEGSSRRYDRRHAVECSNAHILYMPGSHMLDSVSF